ncbi:hypothetical protein M9458_020499, partial [Cirrhinus mrigala]
APMIMAASCCRPQWCCASLCVVPPAPQGTRCPDSTVCGNSSRSRLMRGSTGWRWPVLSTQLQT